MKRKNYESCEITICAIGNDVITSSGDTYFDNELPLVSLDDQF